MRQKFTPKLLHLLLAVLAVLLLPERSDAQFMLNCPPNTTVSTDSATCDALFSYPAPFISGGPVSDTTYNFTGGVQIYVVPPNIGQVTIECWGAQGNTNTGVFQPAVGGLGGYATGDLSVIPGETLYVYVGGGGVASSTGGYNGGGNGGMTANCATVSNGGGGGGASDVRQGGQALTDRKIVGGGGGGGGGGRNQGCGRGSGGGGGGGYYGGGGGAAWPQSSTVVPLGGTQTAGGPGGTSTYTTAAPGNNGGAGSLGQGGIGGNEVGSNQAGTDFAQPGGVGGGTMGGPGAFTTAQNFTGQSGAGGSGYIGGVTNGSMQSGIRSGAGQVKISFSVAFTLTQTAGLASGSVFPPGTTTNAFTVVQGANTDTCSFVVTVVDSVAPVVQGCPSNDTVFAGANCGGPLLDYTTALTYTDNCTVNPTATQTPTAGTIITGTTTTVDLTVTDSMNNTTVCSFQITVVDTTPPTVTSCPPAIVFTPTTFDCNPAVNFSMPTFADNCGASAVGSHQPGDNFPVGTTIVTYTSTDSSGNSSVCSFTLTVTNPVVDGFASASPAQGCVGDTVVLTAPPGYTYMWSTGATTASIAVNMAGDYWVDMTDTSSCTARDSITVTFSQPMPVITPSGASLCTGTNYQSYQWYQNTVAIPGATGPCYTPATDGTFQVIVFDSAGCQGISDTLFFVGVDAALANPGFEIFPNPAQSQLSIRMMQPLSESGAIVLYDLTGRVVLHQAFDRLDGTTVLDLGNLSAGSYIVEIKADNFLGRKRLLRIE